MGVAPLLLLGALGAGLGWMAPAMALGIQALLVWVDLPLQAGPLTIYHNEAYLAGLLVGATLSGRLRGPRAARFALALAPLALVWACLGIWHHAPAGALKGVLRAGQLVAGLLLPALLLRGRERHLVARVWLLGMSISALWALAQSIAGSTASLNAGRASEVFPGGFMAAAAGMGHHNQLGATLVAGLFLCFAALRARGLRSWAWAGLALGSAALVCTLSRGAWASLLLAGLLLSPLLKGKVRWMPWALAGAAVLLVLALPGNPIAQRARILFADSERGKVAALAMQLQAQAPWLGHGPGWVHEHWGAAVQSLGFLPEPTAAFAMHPHNFYALQGLDGGLLLLGAWAVLVVLALGWAWRSLADPGRAWGLALLGALLAFGIQAFTDVPVVHARGLALSLAWGLMLAWALPDGEMLPPKPGFLLFGQAYFVGGLQELLDWLLARDRKPRPVHVANVHTAVSALTDPSLRLAQAEASLRLPDGRPLFFAGKIMGAWEAQQLRGPDVMLAAARSGVKGGTRHYYYGGGEGVAAAVAKRLKADVRGLKVAGQDSPPMGPLDPGALKRLATKLKRLKVDVLWVGLGAPKQEQAMELLRQFGAPCAMVGVGAAFDYFAGTKSEAPVWMQRLALEWAYRLAQEPGRLWKRYLSTNPSFLLLLPWELWGLSPFAAQPWSERLWRALALLPLALAFLSVEDPATALRFLALCALWTLAVGRALWRSR